MAAWLATRSMVCCLKRRIACRAACAAAGLLLVFALPGRAFTPVALADIGPQTNFAIGRIPAGGYLLVWQDVRRSDFALTAQRFNAAGFALGPVETLDVGPVHSQMAVWSVAVGDSGTWGVFYVESVVPDEISVGCALFDAHDKLLKRLSLPDPIPDPGSLIITYHPLAIALSGGGFFLAAEVGTQDDPTASPLQPTRTDVYVMRLDAAGRMVGNAVRVNQTTGGFQRLTGMGGSKDHVVVSWDSRTGGPEPGAVRARFLDGTLTAAGPEVHVAEPDGSAGDSGNSRLAVGADGRAVVAWQGMVTGSGGGPASAGVRMRAFGPAGDPRGGEQAANPSTPGDHFLTDAGLTSEGTVWLSWATPVGLAPAGDGSVYVISLRPFDLAGGPMGDAQEISSTVNGGAFLTGGVGGALVAWRPSPSSPILEGFVVGKAGDVSGPPPVQFAIENKELPGFRTWVRFSPKLTAASWGTPVEPCLPEALCAAGLLPARAEVIVRVIGPQPNAFLWPEIVRFTTDQVEVWVQQKSTGTTRYYMLSAGSPGTETLTGRVDRHAFRP